ncbi:hypothetical protein B1H19_02240 [Streptomyces gilvosporeus]|uniref:4'-phosphopantetheinyl transferase domain-containing protein n=1 Tax=Streptomyces gilvosporeus TaxID=553510 RepID=A0A1V0TJP6_9ACTN|nr:hypothetical protein B1H19_02240 [Streptomyces gilvosporeus]
MPALLGLDPLRLDPHAQRTSAHPPSGRCPDAPCSDVLSPAECDRVRRLRCAGDRADFVAAHLLARLCAAQLLSIDTRELTINQVCESCGGPHGRPSLVGHPAVRLAWSRTRGIVAAAADRRPVGVDIERVASTAYGPRMYELALNPAEAHLVRSATDPDSAFVRQWVRKEALFKAGGAGPAGAAPGGALRFLDVSALPFESPTAERSQPDAAVVVGLHRLGRRCVLDWRGPDRGVLGTLVGEWVPHHVPVAFPDR